jgi:hypothetical protein
MGDEGKLEEWQVLAELRDSTGFANWRSLNKGGWDTLEEHRDPSRCAGVTTERGEITQFKLVSTINLGNSNLSGESPFGLVPVSPVLSRVVLRLFFRVDS